MGLFLIFKIPKIMLLKKLLAFAVGLTVAATVTVLPAQAEIDAEEMDVLLYNLELLCEESFDDLEEMGLYLNDDEADALNYACDYLDGIDDESVSDAHFHAAMELLADILDEVTY
ncbi:MAG: hypothetical protein EA366_11255 [Spirulina sp. DLM2.Bin59]|nr:MAG: hypothetical protein EA366_11255 [Spirulina sp. DLM2.Bin59]